MCKCGCNSCDSIPNLGVVLNESIVKRDILSENLRYHVQNKLPLTENTFRYGSDSFINLWAEARALYLREILNVNDDDKEILTETDLGNYGLYEGQKVPLDLPMLDEEMGEWPKELTSRYSDEYRFELEKVEPTYKNKPGRAKYHVIDIESGELKGTPVFTSIESLEAFADDLIKPQGGTQSTNLGESINEVIDQNLVKGIEVIKQTLSKEGGAAGLEPLVKELIKLGFKKGEVVNLLKDMTSVKQHRDGDYILLPLEEAKKKAKKNTKKLNKPTRDSSGGKAYKVYVKDPKTGNIKTVRFGSGGLRAKINDKKARNAFAARHKCSTKTDKTKASYWSCRLPRYAKLLGLKSSFSGFW